MMEPSTGKMMPAKQDALSMTQSKTPSVRMRPEAVRLSAEVRRPVRNVTPEAAGSPTVGAKCRGVVHGISSRERFTVGLR
jgi:hypothetical protein